MDMQKFFRYGSGVKISISAHFWFTPLFGRGAHCNLNFQLTTETSLRPLSKSREVVLNKFITSFLNFAAHMVPSRVILICGFMPVEEALMQTASLLIGVVRARTLF